MASLKELRQRRKTVTSIYRMTSAMKMVSQSKFNKAQSSFKGSRTLCAELKKLTGRVLSKLITARGAPPTLTYLQPGPSEAPHLLVVFSSDTGMCGGFNQKILKEAGAFFDSHPHCEVICLGKIGASLIQKAYHPKVIKTFTHIHGQVMPILEFIMPYFLHGRISGCSLLYNRFFNVLKQEPCLVRWLPMAVPPVEEEDLINDQLFSYDSPVEETLEALLKLLLNASFDVFMKEHDLSEHGARMAAMDTATENARTMIADLQMAYNHLRQALITKELVEIISGAEALSS